jgi:cation transporter-like permease
MTSLLANTAPTIPARNAQGITIPFLNELVDILYGLQTMMLVIIGICVLLGVGAWIIGRVTNSPNMQRVTGTIVVTCMAGALVVGAAVALVNWAAGRGNAQTFTLGNIYSVTSAF